jgi:hypothetical protein
LPASGGGEGELDMDIVGSRVRPVVPASGMTGLGALSEGLVDDSLDGARASAAFGATAETAIDLLGIARKVVRGADGVADIVVAEDVAGTDNHETEQPFGEVELSIFKAAAGSKRKNRLFK